MTKPGAADGLPSESDHAAAAAVAEWFGSWWADRPNQLVGTLGLARIAALAMDGDARARQAILDGTVEAMLGVTGKQAAFIADSALNMFLSVAAGAQDPSGNPNPATYQADALEWAGRWERWKYSN